MDALNTLLALTEQHTDITEEGFSIRLSDAPAEWDAAIKAVGIHAAYAAMADRLCELYRLRFGREFLFTNACVTYEIEFHADAYFCAMGYSGYVRNVTTLAFTKQQLISHCEWIDISTEDAHDLRQKLMFGYVRGVRECYRGTEADPYRDSR